MVLISFNYKNKTFYEIFEVDTQFNPNWIKSMRMNPDLVSDVKIVAKSRTSYPSKTLMVA